MKTAKRGTTIAKTLKNAGRLRTIVGVFARHGFHNLAIKIKLGRFVIDRLNASSQIQQLSAAERVRMSFEELGPTFVKLGQLLASRPDLVPEEYIQEFEKLHDQVQPLSFDVVESVLKEEFGTNLNKHFRHIQPEPLGSASIAQVHRATLTSGEQVVIKVQRPGIIQKINDDLSVLYFLAELLETYVPESRIFNPVAIVDEYFKTLELETNFVVEANNIRRFQKNLAAETYVKLPQVYLDLTTERVLTMQALPGQPLSADEALSRPGLDVQTVIQRCLRVYLKMVFQDGLFHGDLHAGNVFILDQNEIGLIDFGVVGRLTQKTQTSIANMLLALAREDYDRLAFEYVDLAPFSDKVDIDLFAKELRELIAPYYGLTLKNVNLGKLLMSTAGLAAKHHISVAPELMLFFKSLVHIESIGRRIADDFDFLQHAVEFANEIVKHQYEPTKVVNEISQIVRESRSFLTSLPRQMHFLFRRLNSPDHAIKVRFDELHDLKRAVESSFNLLFLGIIIAALILSASYIYVHETPQNIGGAPAVAVIGYIVAGVLGVVAFVNYIRKP